MVGDPKQSIYRFRRADISVFMAARERFAPAPEGAVELTANFRTVAPVIDWVNATFRTLLEEARRHRGPVSVPARLHRPRSPSARSAASVRRWPSSARSPIPTAAAPTTVRSAESRDVAHVITARARRGVGRATSGDDGWRPCRLGDITILVPARTSLPFLEDALEAARIPYRAESSSLVYATRAVRDLLMVLRAADDPTDHLRIVSALRTPLLGCGDDDLFRHKVLEGRTWSYNTPTPPDPADGDRLRRPRVPARDPREPPLALAGRAPRPHRPRPSRPRARLRRGSPARRVAADALRDRPGPGLERGHRRQPAAYLHWVEQQTAEGSRVAESVLPETDDDAVRIMTIHAAKGLEFPITIVSGLSARPGGMRSPVEVHFPKDGGPVGYRMGKDVITEEFEAAVPIDEQMGYDERLRLLYVACTRACDHLVVSLHRVERKNPPAKNSSRTNAEILIAGMGDAARGAPRRRRRSRAPCPSIRRPFPRRPPTSPTWEAERAAALAAASRPGAVAATALTDEGAPDWGVDGRGPRCRAARARSSRACSTAPPSTRRRPRRRTATPATPEPSSPTVDPGLQKRPRDLDLPPWLKGRYGTAVGRAVHGVLQTIDLATGAGLDDAVAAQCQAEAVPDRADDVRGLVEDALALAGGAGRRRPPALARGVRLHADRRPAARGLRRPALPGRRRPGRRRPQDVRQRRPRRARPPGGGLPAAGCRLRGGGRPGDRRAGRPRRVPVPHPRRRRRARARRPRRRRWSTSSASSPRGRSSSPREARRSVIAAPMSSGAGRRCTL